MLIRERTIAIASADILLGAVLIPWVVTSRGWSAGMTVAGVILLIFLSHRGKRNPHQANKAHSPAAIVTLFALAGIVLVPIFGFFYGWRTGLGVAGAISLFCAVGVYLEPRMNFPYRPFNGPIGWIIAGCSRIPRVRVIA